MSLLYHVNQWFSMVFYEHNLKMFNFIRLWKAYYINYDVSGKNYG